MAALDMMKNVEVKLEPLDPAIVPQVNCNPEIPSKPAPKKRGRPKKIKDPNGDAGDKKDSKQNLITDGAPVKKKRERFKGTTEEEVLTRKLPDHLDYGLDIVIIGINPGLIAAYTGHYFAGPGNHFWKCLFLSGLIPHAMNAYDDTRLLEYGIGFTNIVERTSRGSADLSKKEIQEGAEILKGKIRKYKPRIAVFNGKGIYEIFSGSKKIVFGKQPEPFPGAEETQIFVMPSSSARFTQLPRAVDKVPFYEALKKFRNHLRGEIPKLEDSEITFPNLELKTAPRKEPQVKSEVKLEEPKEKKPAVKKPRKKRTFIQEPGPGHVTGGSTRLTKAHKSLIEQALMMSGDPSTTEGNQSTMPFPPLPQGFGEQQSQNPTDIQMGNNIQPAHDHMQQFFQQNEQMMHPSNAMGNFNPVTTAGSFMNPAALQSMGGGFGFNPNPNPQWNQFPNQGQYQQQGNNQFGFGNMMPSGQNNPQFDMNACHIIQPQINGALTDECNTVKVKEETPN